MKKISELCLYYMFLLMAGILITDKIGSSEYWINLLQGIFYPFAAGFLVLKYDLTAYDSDVSKKIALMFSLIGALFILGYGYHDYVVLKIGTDKILQYIAAAGLITIPYYSFFSAALNFDTRKQNMTVKQKEVESILENLTGEKLEDIVNKENKQNKSGKIFNFTEFLLAVIFLSIIIGLDTLFDNIWDKIGSGKTDDIWGYILIVFVIIYGIFGIINKNTK